MHFSLNLMGPGSHIIKNKHKWGEPIWRIYWNKCEEQIWREPKESEGHGHSRQIKPWFMDNLITIKSLSYAYAIFVNWAILLPAGKWMEGNSYRISIATEALLSISGFLSFVYIINIFFNWICDEHALIWQLYIMLLFTFSKCSLTLIFWKYSTSGKNIDSSPNVWLNNKG